MSMPILRFAHKILKFFIWSSILSIERTSLCVYSLPNVGCSKNKTNKQTLNTERCSRLNSNFMMQIEQAASTFCNMKICCAGGSNIGNKQSQLAMQHLFRGKLQLLQENVARITWPLCAQLNHPPTGAQSGYIFF